MEILASLRSNEIKDLIKAQYKHRHLKTRPICIVGHTGIGKTDTVKQACQELGIECRIINLQFFESPAELSLPYIDNDKKMRHAYSNLIPTEGKGIIFFDEVNRCNRDLRQALITILIEHKFNDLTLGNGWMPVLAMNPVEMDGVSYEVSEFDRALEDRIAKVIFEGNTKDTIGYLTSKYSNDNPVIDWINNSPETIDYKGKTKSTPRALEYLINRIATDNEGKLDTFENINFNSIALELGKDLATVFYNFLNNPETIKAKDIYINGKKPIIQRKIKALIDKKANDRLNALNVSLAELIAKDKTYTKAKIDNLVTYLEALSAEFFINFMLELDKELKEKFNDLDQYEKQIDNLIKPILDKSPKIKEAFKTLEIPEEKETKETEKTETKEKTNETAK